MNDDQFNTIVGRLDIIINNLMALDENTEQKDRITTLNRLGLKPSEISKILGTSANTVSVTLSQRRRN